ncbi:hypothetical protein TNCV_4294211 [Trichonephila clavipes]|uniref:Uncharacterized protein n=1 Tax=Trichonephila clavipes TaxID=2585209 RepID=A0A8X6RFM9_TRICX|nr:hypothetical protein TNCV_4294211 [Trichonephila clavipes]
MLKVTCLILKLQSCLKKQIIRNISSNKEASQRLIPFLLLEEFADFNWPIGFGIFQAYRDLTSGVTYTPHNPFFDGAQDSRERKAYDLAINCKILGPQNLAFQKGPNILHYAPEPYPAAEVENISIRSSLQS